MSHGRHTRAERQSQREREEKRREKREERREKTHTHTHTHTLSLSLSLSLSPTTLSLLVALTTRSGKQNSARWESGRCLSHHTNQNPKFRVEHKGTGIRHTNVHSFQGTKKQSKARSEKREARSVKWS